MHTRALMCSILMLLALPAAAAAHVEIGGEIEPGQGAVFTVTSPNENETEAMTGLRLTVPERLTVAAIGQAEGFEAEIVRDQSDRPVALSWQGGSLPPEGLGVFQFQGTVSEGGDVTLTGVQTFADGTNKDWQLVIEVGHSHTSDSTARIAAAIAVALGLAAVGLALLAMRRARR